MQNHKKELHFIIRHAERQDHYSNDSFMKKPAYSDPQTKYFFGNTTITQRSQLELKKLGKFLFEEIELHLANSGLTHLEIKFKVSPYIRTIQTTGGILNKLLELYTQNLKNERVLMRMSFQLNPKIRELELYEVLQLEELLIQAVKSEAFSFNETLQAKIMSALERSEIQKLPKFKKEPRSVYDN